MTELAPGTTLGSYRLERRLGAGAFAEVWLAVEGGDLGFRKKVALKVLSKAGKEGSAHYEALVNEARICGHLHHPHIVDVYGVGEQEGLRFIAMEYVDGVTLADLLEEVVSLGLTLPHSVVVDIGIQVAQALDHAHSAADDTGNALKIVHRDLKPANVMLARRGGVKVADFGIAKASTNVGATTTGTLKGTPCYVAPEVWTGTRDFLPRVDLFALGAILWEMVTLTRMLASDEIAGLAGQAIFGSADEEAERIRPLFPEIVPIVRELIERDPEKRMQRASSLVARLRDLRRCLEVPGDIDLYLQLLELATTTREQREAALVDVEMPTTSARGWSQILAVVTGSASTLVETSPLAAPWQAATRLPQPRPGGRDDTAAVASPGRPEGAGPLPTTACVADLTGAPEVPRSRAPQPAGEKVAGVAGDTQGQPAPARHVRAVGEGKRCRRKPAKRGRRIPRLAIGLGVAGTLALLGLGVALLAIGTTSPGPPPAPTVTGADAPLPDTGAVDPRGTASPTPPSAPDAKPPAGRGPGAASGTAPVGRAAPAPISGSGTSKPGTPPPESQRPEAATPAAPTAAPGPEPPPPEPASPQPTSTPPRSSCVVFQSTPPGARVWLDGEQSGLVARSGGSARRAIEPGESLRVGMGMGAVPTAEVALTATAGARHVVRCDLLQKLACAVSVEPGGCE